MESQRSDNQPQKFFLLPSNPPGAGLTVTKKIQKDTSEAIRLSNENLSVRGGLPLLELLAGETFEAPQTIKAVATFVGCMPKLDCKTLC